MKNCDFSADFKAADRRNKIDRIQHAIRQG